MEEFHHVAGVPVAAVLGGSEDGCDSVRDYGCRVSVLWFGYCAGSFEPGGPVNMRCCDQMRAGVGFVLSTYVSQAQR